MLVFNNYEEMETYYNEETSTYEFVVDGKLVDVTFNFDLVRAVGDYEGLPIFKRSIKARDIYARNMSVRNIEACYIKANVVFATYIYCAVCEANKVYANSFNCWKYYEGVSCDLDTLPSFDNEDCISQLKEMLGESERWLRKIGDAPDCGEYEIIKCLKIVIGFIEKGVVDTSLNKNEILKVLNDLLENAKELVGDDDDYDDEGYYSPFYEDMICLEKYVIPFIVDKYPDNK